MLRAYEGTEPYIFISYSHKNKSTVLPVIEALQNAGYHVWFDIGIEAGSEWPEYIASHLRGCACVLTFISNDFVRSHNCRRELLFAQHHEKPLLNIYIEEVELSEGMQMQLCLNQALWKKNFPTDKDFHDAIVRARIIQDCKAKPPVAVPVQEEKVPEKKPEKTAAAVEEKPKPKPAPEAKPKPQPKLAADTKPKEATKPAEKKVDAGEPMHGLGGTVCLLEFAYCVAAPVLINVLTGRGVGGWMVLLALLVAHLGISLACFFILRTPSKKMKEDSFSTYAFLLLVLCAVTSVLSVIIGIFNISSEINVFLKILLSLGWQIVPAACSAFMYFMLIGTGPKR